MKKFFVFAVLLLILAMTMVFVACNPNDAEPIKLKEGMTLDSVKTEFKNLESMTYEAYDKDGNLVYVSTSTSNGSYRANFTEGYTYAEFIEDGRAYEFITEGNKLEYVIISTAGFDVCTSVFSEVDDILKDLFEEMEEKGFRIENNEIIVEYGAQDDSNFSKIVAKDFNTAAIPVPESLKKSYKSLATTTAMLDFEDIDGTTCKLVGSNLVLNSLIVPEKNGEKTVVEADLGDFYAVVFLKTVVIPKTVKKINGLYEGTDITFLGTKAEWFAVDLGIKQEKSLYNVHCSDGNIKVGDDVVKSNPDTPDTPDTPDKPDQPDKPDTPDKPTDDPNYPGTKLTPGMTLAELKAALKKVDSLTCEVYDLDGVLNRVLKVEKNRLYTTLPRDNAWGCILLEGDKYYVLESYNDVDSTVINVANYSVADFSKIGIDYLISLCFDGIQKYGFTIENNSVVIKNNGVMQMKLSNINNTTVVVPYDNYQALKPNKQVLEYSNIDDATCEITNINIELDSLTVPSAYKGRTVVSVNFGQQVGNVTLPNTIKSFSGLTNGSYVTYQGTKEEWAEIMFDYSNNQEPFNVHCTDGDIQSGSKKLKPKPENVQAFFNTLWEKSSSIGNAEIAQNDDLKIDLGFTVKFATQDDEGIEYQTIDLGVDLDLVLDRSSAKGSSEHTAIKARLYDPSNSETWVALYYFFNDVDNVYVDFAGQNFKVPFDYLNDTFNKNFDNFINSDKFSQNKTIGEMIAAVTENMGANWNLNVLVDDIVKFFGINLKDMIADNDMIGGIIEGLLGDGATVDDIFDGDVLNIRKILTNDNIAQVLFIDDDTIINRNGFYSTAFDLNGDIGGMVVGMIPEGVDKIINANTELYLQYQLKNNALDSFGIKAVLTEIESTVGETTVYPAITINITDLKCSKARRGEIENSMPVKKTNYSTNAVLDTSAVLDLAGFSLDATKLDSLNGNRFSQVAGLDNLQLKGQISVGFTRKIDFKDNNGIAAYAHLSYKADGVKNAVKVLEVSFVNGNLAVVVNQKANLVALDSNGKTVNVPIASTFINLWGDYAYNALKKNVFVGNPEVLEDLAGKLFKDSDHRVINPNFVGAEWTGLDIVTGFKGIMDGLFAEKPANESADMATIIGNVVKTVEKALPLVSTADNKLTVATDNIGNTVNSIGRVWWGKKTPDFKESIIAADKDKWLDKFTEAIKIEGATYTTKQDFLKAIFNSSANVVLDMSKNGLALDLDVKVTKDASVKLKLNIGAKASATITDLSAGWKEDANTFVFNISQKPTGGSVSETGILTVNGVDGALVEAIYKRDIVEKDKDGKDVTRTVEEYVTIEGTWKDGVFTSAKALDGVKEGGLVKVRLTAKGSDGPCFGVKMTNNYKAPKSDAQ